MNASALLLLPAWSLAILAMARAAMTDVRHRIIPDRHVLMVVGAGLVLRAIGFDVAGVAISVAIATGALVLLGQLARFDIVGGGDAKMVAAATLLFAPRDVPRALACIAIAGGVLAIAWIVGARLRPVPRTTERRSVPDQSFDCLPYGVAILLGTLAFQCLEILHQCSTVDFCWS